MSLSIPYPAEGTYVIGGTGLGKSSFLANQMIERGEGFALIDPKGDLADLVYSHTGGTVLDVESANFGINLFACEDPGNTFDVDQVVDRVMEVFTKVFLLDRAVNTRLRLYLAMSVRILVATERTLGDLPRFLMDKPFRDGLLGRVTGSHYDEEQRFWSHHDKLRDKDERIESTYTRVMEFLRSALSRRIFSAKENTVDWTEAMDSGDTVIVRLSPRLSQLSALVGAVVMSQIAAAAFSRQERFPYGVYCDEYHRFATPATNELLTMGRSFGIGMAVAHQHRSQLDEATQGATLQVGNVLVFRVGPNDARELSRLFLAEPMEGGIVGYVAKQVPSPRPVEDLIQRGHVHEQVHEFVREILVPLVGDARGRHDREVERGLEATGTRYVERGGGNFTYRVASLNEGIEALNRWLSRQMRDPVDDHSPECAEYVVGVLRPLRAWIGIVDEGYWSEQVREITPMNMGKPRDNRPLPPKWWETPITQRQEAALTALCTRWTLEEGLGDELYDAFGVKRQSFPMWIYNLIIFAAEVLHAGKNLAKEPVLVDTHQREEKRGQRESFDNTWAEIANQLANLPRGSAYVKIRTDDGYHQGCEELEPSPEPGWNTFIPEEWAPDLTGGDDGGVYYDADDEEPPSI